MGSWRLIKRKLGGIPNNTEFMISMKDSPELDSLFNSKDITFKGRSPQRSS